LLALAQRICPPQHPSVMVRRGVVTAGPAVNELGVYGVFLSDGVHTALNEPAGHLLRTKVEGTDEGGVAAGFAVLDSPYLT
jgi:hypothetical protein